jgi:hypothetical protein
VFGAAQLARDAILLTPRQQSRDGKATKTGTPSGHGARLLGHVFALERVTCPLGRRGSLHIMAASTQESVIMRILRHLQLASVPPPRAPARCRQECFACASTDDVWRGSRGDVRGAALRKGRRSHSV